MFKDLAKIEPRREKPASLRGFRPGPTNTDLYSHRSRLERRNSGFKKKRDCIIRVAKTTALIMYDHVRMLPQT